MTTQPKRITIVIPNYNGMKFLPDCIDSIEAQTVRDFDVLVVDNASSDDSVEYLKKRNIPVIQMQQNTGFAAAVNAGILAATTDYVLLLNNDTKLFPDFIQTIESEATIYEKKHFSKKVFSINPMMINMYQPDIMDDAGDGMNILGYAYQIGCGESIERHQKRKEVFSGCGGASLYDRKLLIELGLFDEAHFAYLEDVDVGYRARLAGYRNVYCPHAKVYHAGSGTTGSKYNDFKVRLSARNNIYLLYKNQPALQLLLNSPFIIAGILLKLAFFSKKGFLRVYISGVLEGLRTCSDRKKAFIKSPWTCLQIEGQLLVSTFAYFKQRAKLIY